MQTERVFTGEGGAKPVFEGEGRGFGPAPLENFVRTVRLGAGAHKRGKAYTDCTFNDPYFRQAWHLGYSLAANGVLTDG